MARDERLDAIHHFTHGGGRLLLATDAGGEGLNLQRACRLVVNLELPWNPMRLEQRIGRVDRIGQRRTVHVIHLIARDSNEARVLGRLQSRIERARADIGSADPLGIPGAGSSLGILRNRATKACSPESSSAERRETFREPTRLTRSTSSTPARRSIPSATPPLAR